MKSQDDFFFLAFLVIKKFGLRSFARERERERLILELSVAYLSVREFIWSITLIR